MKTLRLSFIALAGCLGLLSCSDDDSENNNNNGNEVAGTYNLTMVSISEEIDFDQDGTANTDLMLESPCYLDSHIMVNDDGTYTSEYSYVFHESETGCTTETQEGTWDVEGDNLMLTNVSMWPTPAPVSYTRDGNTLVLIMEESPYPDRDELNQPIYTTGEVILTYTKVE